MESNRNHPVNGAAPTSKGAVPKGQAQDEHQEVKEGNSSQQRPEHGSDAGPNTSSRDQQLPTLDKITPSAATREDK